MRQMLQVEELHAQVQVDSAGTGSWHVGHPPDARSAQAALRRGYTLTGHARQVRVADLHEMDYLLALDRSNLADLRALAVQSGASPRAELALLRDFDPESPTGQDVPDPYYGGAAGFDHVLDVVEAACAGLLRHLRRELAGHNRLKG